MRLHSKYYCGRIPDEKEWTLRSSKAYCFSCKTELNPAVIEFHVKYLCHKKMISVQCFYCQKIWENYRSLLNHMVSAHKRKHCYLDLISILPPADSTNSTNATKRVVKHFFNLSAEAQVEDKCSIGTGKKTFYPCKVCGKVLSEVHAYQNHMNTNCNSKADHYSCFFCSFESKFAYQTLEHMQSYHKQQFNTYDLIQAELTGITPTIVNDNADVRYGGGVDPKGPEEVNSYEEIGVKQSDARKGFHGRNKETDVERPEDMIGDVEINVKQNTHRGGSHGPIIKINERIENLW